MWGATLLFLRFGGRNLTFYFKLRTAEHLTELEAVIEQLLETGPQTMGYAFTVWNAPRLLVYLKEQYQVTMHSNTLRNLLAKMDYVYRRPKHELASLQDKEAKAIAQENLAELKKSGGWRNRTFLSGRNEPNLAVLSRALLDA